MGECLHSYIVMECLLLSYGLGDQLNHRAATQVKGVEMGIHESLKGVARGL